MVQVMFRFSALHVCIPETLKYWVSIQLGHSYHMGRRCLLALVGHPSSDSIKMIFFFGGGGGGGAGGTCFITSNSLAIHLLLLSWLQLNLTLFLDQLRLA